MRTICLATNNAHKLGELQAAFAPLLPDVRLVALNDAGGPFDDIPEDGATFEENALLKARGYAALTGLPTLADDSGLCVDCLDGRPGVFSARYAESAAARIERVVREVGEARRAHRPATTPAAAHFVCVMALVDPARPGDAPLLASGTVDGEIVSRPRGAGGFGYDPVFLIPSLGRTMAELTPAEKNGLSHRGRAAAAMARLLAAHGS